MIQSLKDEKYLIPYDMSRDAFIDSFKEYALHHKLLPLSFFSKMSINIQGYYIPAYLFSGQVDSQWMATRYSSIETTRVGGIANNRLKSSFSRVAKPVASTFESEFSILSPSCKFGKIPEPLWEFINGYEFDITEFRGSLEVCDTPPTTEEQSIKVLTIDNTTDVVWEDYAKYAVSGNASMRQADEIRKAKLEDSSVNSLAKRDADTHIVYMPCWCAQIQFEGKDYYAVSIANSSHGKLSCNLPISSLQKAMDSLWGRLSFVISVVFSVYCVKGAKILAKIFLGYVPPANFLGESFIYSALWIATFILGFKIYYKIEMYIQRQNHHLKESLLRSTFSTKGIH